jgi:DNA ligase (NAD+)
LSEEVNFLFTSALEELKSSLAAADRNYYDFDAPSITDHAYDLLCAQYLVRTGVLWKSQGSTGDVAHERPMLSLDKAHGVDEVSSSLGADTKVCITPKIDGLGLSLRYSKCGQLVRGLTRGKLVDKVSYGEDVTAQARKVTGVLGVSLGLGTPVEVRGEVYLPPAALAAINLERVAAGEKPYVNARNAAAGILRSVDSRWHQELKFLAVKALNPLAEQHDDDLFKTEEEMFEWLYDCGFQTPQPLLFSWVEHVSHKRLAAYRDRDIIEQGADYETDGVVLTVDSWAQQRSMGLASKFPRYAVAYKFEDSTAEAVVQEILWATTRTGRVVPRYRFSPVELEGATIEYATGHNLANVIKIGAVPGDTVEVFRANQVVPQVRRVVAKATGSTFVDAPSCCAACSQELETSEVDLLCTNATCGARLPELIQYSCSKKNLDVDGVGPALAEALVESEFLNIKNLYDFLALAESETVKRRNMNDLPDLDVGGKRLGTSAAQKLLDGIEKARSKPWNIVLHSLGCPGLGEPECKTISELWSLSALLSWPFCVPNDDLPDPKGTFIKHLTAMKGVGLKTAETFYNWLEANHAWLTRLDTLGFNTEAAPAAAPVSTQLSGMSFCLTGRFSRPRDVVAASICAAGGAVTSSLSKRTSYLVAGDDPGSKLVKAMSLMVSCITELELLEMLRQKNDELHL